MGAASMRTRSSKASRTDRVLQLIEGFVPETAWLSDAGIVENSASNVCEMVYFCAIRPKG